jgi:flagellar hook-length control protein FliK
MAAAAHPGEMKGIRPAASDTGTAHRLPEAAAARGRPTTPATSNAVALDAAAAAQGSPGDTVARSVAEATAAPATPPLSAAPPAPSAPQAAARPADLPPPFAALVADLEPPLHSPAFAPALGARLVAFVRDGIEQAELRLNPAELGPIAVRISLDGTQAQVDFHAAQAQTRHALHEALPALAGALRDSGLTLAGGGVFEQPRQPRGDARDTRDDRSRFGAGHAAAAPAAAPLAATRRARGVLDVFA